MHMHTVTHNEGRTKTNRQHKHSSKDKGLASGLNRPKEGGVKVGLKSLFTPLHLIGVKYFRPLQSFFKDTFYLKSEQL